ncbi:MAG: excinuclease ABC subunit UvrC [Flavobacteriaceae bacterium]|jgi:excinuclease ABC subunit C|nr:excinuclease ABC subunit UvrC [Flavobacteriaceae bacterium]MDG0967935.1 excinuclease ABC subunit UvrC [Flavobacteriaceae bacterium]
MSKEALKLHVQSLPQDPGVYQFYDKKDSIIYVGKAKNLKNRVSSYFRKNLDSRKTQKLVKNIETIKHIVVPTESDALILENTLIKEHQPRYNILLRDDKTYPWICIKKEAFPRVFTTRKVIKDGSEYFGPFTNSKTVRLLMTLIRELYPLRNCSYDLRAESIETKNYKVCLEYHIGNCLGGCIGEQKEENYNTHISEIRALLRGNFSEVIRGYKQKMKLAADSLQFEEAQKEKTKIELLANYQVKSAVVSAAITNVDVCTLISDEQSAFVNYLHVAYGSIVRFHNMEIKKKLEESDEDLLRVAIVELRRRFHSSSKDVILPIAVALGDGVRVHVPQKGEKKKLLELSVRNAKQGRLEHLKQIKIADPKQHTTRLLNQMKKDLRLRVLPDHIECFDNSNIQGSNPVAACVVFRNAKPAKKEYRHYIIKTVTGANDYASMEEVIYRRYKRLLDEKQDLPQLVVIDGGKGQLSSALLSIDALNLRSKIAVIGIAKRLEEIYYPNDSIPMYLDKRSETLKIIQQLRNEAHRFGVRLHRNRRSKHAVSSSLDGIAGIGEKTAVKLLKTFKSVKRIKDASINDLASVIGESKAREVHAHFHIKDK